MANVTFGGPLRTKVGGIGIDIMDGNNVIMQRRYQKTKIATADVLTMQGTPVEVLPAVGTTNFVRFEGAFVFQDFNAAGYTAGSGEDLVITLAGAGAEVSGVVDGTMIDGAEDFLVWLAPAIDLTIAVGVGLESLVTNSSFEITIKSGQLSVGDSDWDVVLFYTLFPAAGLEALS